MVQSTSSSVEWAALTTGNIGGVDLILDDAESGTIYIETPLVKEQLKVNEVGLEDKIFSNDGVLPRTLTIMRLPDINEHFEINFIRKIQTF